MLPFDVTPLEIEGKAPAKRSQHVNAPYRNMLRAFGHPVAMCCEGMKQRTMQSKCKVLVSLHFLFINVIFFSKNC